MNIDQNIYKYDECDRLIKNKLNELTQLRRAKTQLINSIITYLNEKNIDHAINSNNGNKFKKIVSKNYTPLTFQFIRECLIDIIPREDQIDKIIQYIKSKRNFKLNQDLRRMN